MSRVLKGRKAREIGKHSQYSVRKQRSKRKGRGRFRPPVPPPLHLMAQARYRNIALPLSMKDLDLASTCAALPEVGSSRKSTAGMLIIWRATHRRRFYNTNDLVRNYGDFQFGKRSSLVLNNEEFNFFALTFCG